MKPPEKSYKEIHGTTRVGDFLRSIGNSKVLETVGDVLPDKGVLGLIKNLVFQDDTLTTEQREHALKLIELDLKEAEEITKRWQADMNSDSWLSKNIRPLTLAALTITFFLLVILDSTFLGFTVESAWIELLKNIMITVYLAYFGSRGFEKVKSITK